MACVLPDAQMELQKQAQRNEALERGAFERERIQANEWQRVQKDHEETKKKWLEDAENAIREAAVRADERPNQKIST
eukprot:5046593-Prorocentrum_lima.AAC.1